MKFRKYFETVAGDVAMSTPAMKLDDDKKKKKLTQREAILRRESKDIFEGLTDAGTCYPDAYQYFESHYKDSKMRLVHTLVAGQGQLEGITYNHAFCVSGNKVIDPSQRGRTEFPKDLYYAIGGINEKSKYYFEYTHEEVLANVLETGVYGPWEKVLIKHKY